MNRMADRDRRWTRRLFMLASATSAFAGSRAVLAQANSFPQKPIKIVVPAVAGGALDTISRLMAAKASETLKQHVYIENKPGANWIIGMDAVAKAAPDGYTLLFVASSGLTVNPYVFANMPLEPLKDLAPVTTATTTDFVLLANPNLPIKSVPELISYLKANPGKWNHASNSATTMLVSELFKQQAGVSYVDVNYRGAAQAIQDTAAGVTQICFVDLGTGMGAIEGKLLRPLGTTGPKRSSRVPGVPTIAEQGLPGYAVGSSTLLLGPAKMPADIHKRLTDIFRQTLRDENVRSKLVGMGQDVVGDTPEETMGYLLPEAEQFRKIITEKNIRFGG